MVLCIYIQKWFEPSDAEKSNKIYPWFYLSVKYSDVSKVDFRFVQYYKRKFGWYTTRVEYCSIVYIVYCSWRDWDPWSEAEHVAHRGSVVYLYIPPWWVCICMYVYASALPWHFKLYTRLDTYWDKPISRLRCLTNICYRGGISATPDMRYLILLGYYSVILHYLSSTGEI